VVTGVIKSLDVLRTGVNRRLGRAYIPNPKESLYIETSNICNLDCVFCAYGKAEKPKAVMSNEFFASVIDEATELGYHNFGLTPTVGDVFVDKHFIEKLGILDRHALVEGYHFFTNFTLADEERIDGLLRSTKLTELTISLYGHDRKSFEKMSRGRERYYDQLVENLNLLADRGSELRSKLTLGLRTYQSFGSIRKCDSELSKAATRLLDATNSHFYRTNYYNNWGGFITDEDVAGVDIKLIHEEDVYKNGACALIFYKNMVLADGRVNACACRDVNGTLVIGDLNTHSLGEILSTKNPEYLQLIERQQANQFHDVCGSCDFYRSIYKKHRVYRHHKQAPVDIDSFYAELQENAKHARPRKGDTALPIYQAG